MSEENADSGEVNEVQDSGGFDMEAAQAEISESLFGSSENKDDEIDDKEEGEVELEMEMPEEADKEPLESEEESEEDETPEVIAKAAPQSWKKDMHEKFSKLEPEVQDYIEQREAQMREGLEKDRNDSNLGRSMRDVIAPYEQVLQQNGITNHPDMVKRLLNAHIQLSTADPASKQQLFNQMAQSYGLSVNAGEQPEIDPALQSLQNEVYRLRQEQNQRDQALQSQNEREVSQTLEEFVNDEAHPYFDEVSDEVLVFLNAGAELKDAYEKAVWANPVVRQKELDRVTKENVDKTEALRKQEVDKAKKLKSTNVKGRNTIKTPTGPIGSMEDTMKDVLKSIKSR